MFWHLNVQMNWDHLAQYEDDLASGSIGTVSLNSVKLLYFSVYWKQIYFIPFTVIAKYTFLLCYLCLAMFLVLVNSKYQTQMFKGSFRITFCTTRAACLCLCALVSSSLCAVSHIHKWKKSWIASWRQGKCSTVAWLRTVNLAAFVSRCLADNEPQQMACIQYKLLCVFECFTSPQYSLNFMLLILLNGNQMKWKQE